MSKIIPFNANCNSGKIEVTFSEKDYVSESHSLILDVVVNTFRRCGLSNLELSLETDEEGKLTAGIRYIIDAREKTSPFDMSITKWSIYRPDENGNTLGQYGFCGDINYHDLGIQWEEFFLDAEPESVFFRELKKAGISPDKVALERERIIQTDFDKMSVSSLLDLAETMSEENPILHPSFNKYHTTFLENLASCKGASVGKKLTLKLAKLFSQVKESAGQHESDMTFVKYFALACWSRSIPADKAALFYSQNALRKGETYTHVADLDDIRESMEVDSGTVLARLVVGKKYMAVLKVVGLVRVCYKDEIYKTPSRFPTELLKAFRDGSAWTDPEIEIGNNNWFEIWVYGFNGEKWVETGYYDLVESVGAETLEDLRLSIKEATED